jgi:2-oxoglutarate dehydrogenase E1 component
MEKFSYLKSTNAEYIDEMLAKFQQDPESVDPSWRYFFEGIELGTDLSESSGAPGTPATNAVPAAPKQNGHGATAAGPTVATTPANGGVDLSSEAKVAELITAYRELGRLLADIDPLTPASTSHPLLDLSRPTAPEAPRNWPRRPVPARPRSARAPRPTRNPSGGGRKRRRWR